MVLYRMYWCIWIVFGSSLLNATAKQIKLYKIRIILKTMRSKKYINSKKVWDLTFLCCYQVLFPYEIFFTGHWCFITPQKSEAYIHLAGTEPIQFVSTCFHLLLGKSTYIFLGFQSPIFQVFFHAYTSGFSLAHGNLKQDSKVGANWKWILYNELSMSYSRIIQFYLLCVFIFRSFPSRSYFSPQGQFCILQA